MRIEVVLDVKTTLGEGPLWDVVQQRLYWIDSFDGRVFRSTADGRELRCWDVPQKIGSMALRKDGEGAILSLERGFYTLDFKTGEVTLIHDPEPNLPRNRINDGKVDRRGRFFAGSMDTMEENASGALYRLDPDFSVTRIDSGMTCSNGPCFSPDDKTFYFSDTWTGDIWAYDFDINTGSVSNRRAFVMADMLHGGRESRPRHRDAGEESDERDVRRPQSRHPLCDFHGETAASAFPRRRGSPRQSVRHS